MLAAALLFIWISPSNAQLNSIKRLDGSAITPAAVDYTVTRLMKAANIPRLEIAIFNDSKVAYLKSYRLRDTDKALPLTVNSVMSAASFTKVTFLSSKARQSSTLSPLALPSRFRLSARCSRVSSAGSYRAFLWTSGGGMRDLGTLGGDSAIASGINSAGQVVGWASTASGEVHAFLCRKTSGMRDLGTLGGTLSDGVAINDLGDIAGSASPVGNIRVVAFRQTPGKKMYGLGTLGYRYSYGYAINAAGTVVGSSPLNKNLTPFHAFIHRKGAHLVDIGSLGGDESVALGVSQSEEVVGWSSFTGGYSPQAILWTAASGMRALVTMGGPNSAARAINNKSQIVGFSDLSQTVTHAVLWIAPNQIQDLGTLGGNYATAQGINDLGQVVGWSTLQ